MGKRCFVIMPFSETTDRHPAHYWTTFFSSFLKPTVEKLGYSCSRSKAQPANIIRDILRELVDSDLVIAVLTDYNANVWYELGTRHALRKGTIMMIEEGQKLPFDIHQYGVITYQDTITGTAHFEEELRTFVSRIEEESPPDSPATEFVGSVDRGEYEDRLTEMEASYHSKLDKIVRLFENLQKDRLQGPAAQRARRPFCRRVLWVDDYPANNEGVIELYRQMGVVFDLAVNTAQALDFLASEDYALVISDMGRGAESDAGLRMIHKIKKTFGTHPPIIIYSSIDAMRRFGKRATDAGAVCATSSAGRLLEELEKHLSAD